MPPARPALERFHEKYEVDAETNCWIWKAARNSKGYGYFYPSHHVTVLAHRWIWQQQNGPVPDGLVLDHFVCDNPPCVNPDHVRPVTVRENSLRSSRTLATKYLTRTHCNRGHEFTPDNTRFRSNGGRVCRKCRRRQREAVK